MSLLIKNARLIDRDTDQVMDIYLEDGIIKSLGLELDFQADKIIDAKGLVLMPAFTDLHAHFRYPGQTEKEDLESGSRAALKGGYTSVNLMANTRPPVSSKEIYQDIIDRASELDLIDIYQVMTVSKDLKGEEFIDFDDLPQALKFLSEDGKGVASSHMMYQALLKAKERNLGIMVHGEDMEISSYDYRAAEDLNTIRDIYLAKASGGRLHMSHVSTIASLEAIAYGKEEGLDLTCEVTPHHIYLYDNDYKVNPPIRTKEDVDFIIEMIKLGYVDAIATDHAPHTKEDKAKGAPGMVGLETSFLISYKALVEAGHISLSDLSNIMSARPSQILGIKKGLLKPGYIGDLVLIDLEGRTLVDEEFFQSKGKNSPFIGQEFKTSIEMTIHRGKIKFERKKDDNR